MAHHELRATYLARQLLTYEHRVAAAEIDFRHGLGERSPRRASTLAAAARTRRCSRLTGDGAVRLRRRTSQLLAERASASRPGAGARSTRVTTAAATRSSSTRWRGRMRQGPGGVPPPAPRRRLRAQAVPRPRRRRRAAGAGRMPAGHGPGRRPPRGVPLAVAYLVEIDADGAEPRLTRAFVRRRRRACRSTPRPRGAAPGRARSTPARRCSAPATTSTTARPRGQLRRLPLGAHAPRPPTIEVHVFPAADGEPGGAGELGFPPASAAVRQRLRPRHRHRSRAASRSRLRSARCPSYDASPQRRSSHSVDAPADMPLLWVLRDLLGVTGPKYGCGVGVCGACTSHLDGEAFRPCITPVGRVRRRRRSRRSRGSPTATGCTRCSRLARRGRRPVRLLPAGPDHGGGRAARAATRTRPTPTSTRDARERLPLRHLRPHPRRDQARRRGDERRLTREGGQSRRSALSCAPRKRTP